MKVRKKMTSNKEEAVSIAEDDDDDREGRMRFQERKKKMNLI